MAFEALNRLWNRARESSHDFRASTQVFPTLDADRIARDMELERLGEERGTANEPAAAAAVLDDIEQAIVERIESEKKTAHQTFEDQIQTFNERLRNLDFDGQFSMIKQANLHTVSDYDAECQTGLNELHGVRRDLGDAEAERDQFRIDQKLSRAARVQSTGVWWLKILFLAFCVIIESSLNGVFLSEGSEQGFVGGATLAFSFAVINIGMAVLAAYLIKNSVHRSFFRKTVGVVSAVFYPAAAGALNLALAHYRETSEQFFGEAGREVMDRLLTTPFSLNDIDSWILFAVGMLFSIAALVDSWFLSDPYPGYGGVEKRLQKRRQAYKDAHLALLDELRDIRDENTDKINEIISDLSARKQEYDAIIAHRGRVNQLFAQHQEQLEHTANRLLTIYREKNLKSRDTDPPAYFSESYMMKRIDPPQALVGELNDEELAASIREARSDLSEQMKGIAAKFTEVAEKYKNLDTLHPDKANG